MKILISGITGFLGKRLATSLVSQGHDVLALVRVESCSSVLEKAEKIPFSTYEEIPKIIEKSSPDIIIHIGACYTLDETTESINKLIDSNIKFTSMILKGAAGVESKTIKMMYIGTVWQNENFYKNEVHPNFYALTKYTGWEIARYFSNKFHIPLYGLKLSDTFGVGDKRKKLVKLLIESAVEKKTIDLTGGDQQVLLTAAEDFVDTVEYWIENYADIFPGDYYMPGKIITIKKLSKIISNYMPVDEYHNFGALPYRNDTVFKLDDSDYIYFPGAKSRSFEKELKLLIDAVRINSSIL